MIFLSSYRKEIFVIAATNRPDMIDPAMLRPKRLGILLYVPLPNAESRFKILTTLCRHLKRTGKLDGSVDLLKISQLTEGYSGADLDAVVHEAATLALSQSLSKIQQHHQQQQQQQQNDQIKQVFHNKSNNKRKLKEEEEEEEEEEEAEEDNTKVTSHHFEIALNKIKPSVSEKVKNQKMFVSV